MMPNQIPQDGPLYQRLLGEQFGQLCPALRIFHTTQPRAEAEGNVSVEGGRTRLARLVALLMGLPQSAEEVKVRLAVSCEEQSERWERWFGDAALVSRQWARQGQLIESFGTVAIGFGLVVEQGGMRFVPQRLWWLGLPLPRAVGPRIEAMATPHPEGWSIDVSLSAPLVGRLVRYHGILRPL